MTLKKFFVILLSVFMSVCVLSFIACGDDDAETPEEEEYTITYVLDGGELPDGVINKYKKPEAAIQLPIPSKIGYDFIGWKEGEGDYVTSIAAGSTGNKTFTAFWEKIVYEISYDLAGGTQATTGAITSYTISATETALPVPTKTGYNFVGWKDNGGDPITSIAANVVGKKVLTAEWSAKTYTITFNYGAGSGDVEYIDVNYDANVGTLPTPSSIPVGYNFVSWKKANGDPFANGTKYTIDDDLTLTAYYEPIKYSIGYDPAGGEQATEGVVTSYTISTTEIALPTPTRTGYDFVGWKEGTNSPITSLAANTIGNKSFVAVWSAKTYKITFNYGDGSGDVGYINIEYDANVELPQNPTPPVGYKFVGWKNGDNDFANGTKYQIDDDLTLTAYYEIVEYVIEYNVSGGTQATEDVITSYTVSDTPFDLPTPSRVGYTFDGWKDGDNEPITSLEANTTGNKSFVAVWNAKSYRITFNYGAGSGDVGYIDVNYDANVELPQNPTPPVGYNFVSWKNGDNYFKNGTKYQIDDDLTLTADYEKINYSIEYNVSGGTQATTGVITSYTISSDPIALPTPTRTGYDFVGWKEGTNSPITSLAANTIGNKSFVAVWSAKTYKITFNYGDGSGDVEYKDVNYDASVGTLPTPTSLPEGKLFINWKYGETVFKSGSVYTVADNITLTAEYGVNVVYTLVFDNSSKEPGTEWAEGNPTGTRSITDIEEGMIVTPPKMKWDNYSQAQKENGYSIIWYYYDDYHNQVVIEDFSKPFEVKDVSGNTITLYIIIEQNYTPNY